MMKRLAISVVLAACAGISSAQSLPGYLEMRKRFNVKHTSDVDTIQSVADNKVIEIQGVVKGSFRVDSHTTLLVEQPGGGPQHEVETDIVPDWLVDSETPARLLVKVVHHDASSPTRILMLGVARDAEMRKYDPKPVAKRSAPRAETQPLRSSREFRSGLFGPIGRGGTRNERRVPTAGVVPPSEALPVYASFIKRVNPRLRNSDAMTMARALIKASLDYEVDARLVVAMVVVESGFDPNSVSSTGAMGLGQLMPGTAQWMGVRNPFDTVDNLYGMVRLIRTHLNQYHGDLDLTLAAYNAGIGAVARHGGVPPYRETQRYVQKVKYIFFHLRGEA